MTTEETAKGNSQDLADLDRTKKTPARKKFNVRGLSVSDYVAVSGFALALVGNGYLLIEHLRGAELTFFPPDEVEFRCTEFDHVGPDQFDSDPDGHYHCSQRSNLTLTATMSYVNTGRVNYNAVLRREYASVRFSAKNKVDLGWQYFSDITSVDVEEKVAVPSLIPGAGSLSHETRFYPKIINGLRPNHMKWSDFRNLYEPSNEGIPSPIATVDLAAELFGMEEKLSASCTIEFDNQTIEKLRDHGDHFFAITLPCVQKNLRSD